MTMMKCCMFDVKKLDARVSNTRPNQTLEFIILLAKFMLNIFENERTFFILIFCDLFPLLVLFLSIVSSMAMSFYFFYLAEYFEYILNSMTRHYLMG